MFEPINVSMLAELGNFLLKTTPTLMAFTEVTNGHGHSPGQQHAGLLHAV